jgi:hypothetical protein
MPYKIAVLTDDDVSSDHAVRSDNRTASDHSTGFDVGGSVNSRACRGADAQTAHGNSIEEVQPTKLALKR